MKKIFLFFVFLFCVLSVFFITRLEAQIQAPLVDSEPVISMDFQDANLKDVFKIFSLQSGMNFIASEGVQDRKVTLYLDKVPLSKAMDKIFSANNLTYELDRGSNIFVVKDWGKLGVETITKVFFLKNATVSSSSLIAEMSKQASNGGTPQGEGGITGAVRKLLSTEGSVIEDFRTNSLTVTDTPSKMEVITKVNASLEAPVSQVLLEVEMLDVSKNKVDKVGFKFGETPLTAIVTGATASMGFPYGSWKKILDGNKGSLSINPSADTYQVQLDFLRTQTDTKYLARPRLLTLNNETAEISITTDEIVGREDTVVDSTSGTTTTSVFKRSTDLALTKEGTGIYLRVTPQINLERNEITMVINPKSSVSSTSDLSVTGNLQSNVEVRFTRSIVKVLNGETVVLGGLIHRDKSVTIKKLPFFGDIPFLGALFRHRDQTKDIERELLVFITPRIVKDKADMELVQGRNMNLPLNLPVREQGIAVGGTREGIVSASLNNFKKNSN